jgi:Ni/Co efflux regulator RcnB
MGVMMKSRILVTLLALAGCSAVSAKGAVPADIRAFVKNAEACEHLAGEWDSDLDPARKREIERGVDRYCLTAQRQLRQVETKYRQNRALFALIAQHSYDSVRSYSK